nr:hypothetical protein [Mesorhizobium escarrei]
MTDSSLSTSISTTSSGKPFEASAPRSAAACALRSPTSRIVATTRLPLPANPSAIKRPKPELLPVIRTTFGAETAGCANAGAAATAAKAAPVLMALRRDMCLPPGITFTPAESSDDDGVGTGMLDVTLEKVRSKICTNGETSPYF